MNVTLASNVNDRLLFMTNVVDNQQTLGYVATTIEMQYLGELMHLYLMVERQLMELYFDCLLQHVNKMNTSQMTLYELEIGYGSFLVAIIILPFTVFIAQRRRRNMNFLQILNENSYAKDVKDEQINKTMNSNSGG
jgi:hypothetical protein